MSEGSEKIGFGAGEKILFAKAVKGAKVSAVKKVDAPCAFFVLFEGKATLKQIYVATCYSIMPMVINAIGYDILANVLTLNEANFINILNYACIFYTAILLIMGIINVQEFGFGKFVFTTVVTVLAMILVVFLVFLVGILLQQAGNFVQTVFLEAFYR